MNMSCGAEAGTELLLMRVKRLPSPAIKPTTVIIELLMVFDKL